MPTEASVNVVLSFVGPLPAYTLTCIRQLRYTFDGPIYLIYSDMAVDIRQQLETYSIIFVPYETVKSQRFENIAKTKSFAVVDRLKERKDLFKLSYERFYLLDSLMRQRDLEHVWFMELDIMMYHNPNQFLPILEQFTIGYTYVCEGQCSTAILYVRGSAELESLLDTLDGHSGQGFMNEMSAVYYRHLYSATDLIFPTNPVFSLAPPSSCKFKSLFGKYLFDGATMGQFLFGVDPIHTGDQVVQQDTRNIQQHHHYWDYGKFEWHLDEQGRYLPYYRLFGYDTLYPIVNLHIHSKDLNSARSDLPKQLSCDSKCTVCKSIPKVPTEKFDIISCCGPNDITVLPEFLRSIEKHVKGYRNIYVITTISIIDKYSTAFPNVKFIPESSFPVKKEMIDEMFKTPSRSGWYLQQLLKLYAPFCIPECLEKYVIIDCDVYFYHTPSFFKDNKLLFNVGTEYHKPYFEHMSKLHPSLGKVHSSSGICHMMPMKRHIVQSLMTLIEQTHKKEFWKVFLENVQPKDYEFSGASEYELLFTFSLLNFSNEVEILPVQWRNVGKLSVAYEGVYEACHHYARES